MSVHDVARGCRLALETPAAAGQVFNIGSGNHYTIRELAECIATVMDKEHIEPEVTSKYRVGDVRGSFYDFTAERFQGTLREILASEPEAWGGRAAVDWAAQLLRDGGYRPDIANLILIAQSLDQIYENAKR